MSGAIDTGQGVEADVQLTDRTLDILATLVGFDTTSHKSNLALIDWAEAYLRRYGFTTELFLDATGTKANLLATIGPACELGYVLSGHTDVVPVDGQIWTNPPFELHVDEGRVYGRGACDMKGFLAVCLAQAPAMAAAPLNRPLHLALSYDEEVGCLGARQLCSILRQRNWRAAGCFVGEPTLMRVAIGHKGKRNVRVTVSGRTCHSSLAPSGVNAVAWGAQLIGEITRISEALAESGAQDDLYDVPHSTGHVGVFSGGTALNIVPSKAELLFEFRTLARDDADALVAAVERFACETLEPQMRRVDPHAGFTFEVYASTPGLDVPTEAHVVSLAKRLAGRNDHAKVDFMTEAGLFQHVADIPTVVIGPGSIDQAHKADEWVAVSELERCSAFVADLIAHCRR
jgi:acetylornithine deacetylase